MNQPGRPDPSALIGLLCFLNNCYQIKVNQISLRKCPEIYIENYVDVTVYDLGKQS